MIDDAGFRELALALPEAEEHDHFGRPSFRVRGKIFAGLREHDGEPVAVVNLPEAYQQALIGSEPDTFSAVVWGNLRGRTRVRLATADPAELAEILEEAWRKIAPKKLIATLDKSTETQVPPAKGRRRSRLS